MNRSNLLRILWIAVASLGFGGLAQAADLPAAEKTKIESLIYHIEGLQGAKFIRNGSEYDAKTAGKFLRGKWDANAKEIKTAEDFISKAATQSNITGKPYLIRPKDEADKPCGDYLRTRLKAMESGKK